MAEVAALRPGGGWCAEQDAPAHDAQAFVDTDNGESRLHLLVENLHCGGCLQRIEGALNALPGVIAARASLSERRVDIRFATDQVTAEKLVRTLLSIGYRAVPFAPERLRTSSAREDRALLRALAVAGFAAANVMLLSVAVWAGDGPGGMGPATRDFLHWVSALIALPAVAYAGQPFFRAAFAALKGGHLNMDVPISLAVLCAAAMSVYQTANGQTEVYFDAAVSLLFLLLIGRYLDRRARRQARSAAEQLSLLGASTARVLSADGRVDAVPLDQLRAGMRVIVAPGDRIPADGQVSQDASRVDCSLLTGETTPEDAGPGSAVYAGALNCEGSLQITVKAAGEGTLLAEIARLVRAAEQSRSRYVRLADRLAAIYAPAVHIVAAATFAGWLALGAGWEAALLNAIAVLVITCPCALGLAVPAVQVVATGRLLRAGVLVKSGDALERLAEIDRVVFDKTGTLTLGRPELANGDAIAAADLHLAAALAAASRHPLARALAHAAGVDSPHAGVREEPGMGLCAQVDGAEVRLGNRAWCAVPSEADETGTGPELWLVRAGEPPVRFLFDDALKADARQTLDALRKSGLDSALLSGDRQAVVARIANEAGLTAWRAGQRPADKAARLQTLKRAGHRVLMVGDGLNDAPALATAHVSMAPASGADISRAAADFVFQGDRLSPVIEAWRVARSARRLALQNFAVALGYNAVAVPLAMAGQVTPLFAAVAMSASSLLVIANALRLWWKTGILAP